MSNALAQDSNVDGSNGNDERDNSNGSPSTLDEDPPPGKPYRSSLAYANHWFTEQKMVKNVKSSLVQSVLLPLASTILEVPDIPHIRGSIPPNYDLPSSWAARPYSCKHSDGRASVAEMVPPDMPSPPPEAMRPADVFYIHPTGYFGRYFNQQLSTADAVQSVDKASAAADEHTDYWMVSTQASCFNESCRVWAPHYRQASFLALSDNEALNVAYSDCRRSFLYFLSSLPSASSPFVLASHSQGGVHLKRLIEEFVDPSPEIRRRLVVAYLVGSHLPTSLFGSSFRHIHECDSPDDIQCIAGWDTISDSRMLERVVAGQLSGHNSKDLCTNPLTWRSARLSEEGARKLCDVKKSGLYLGGIDVVMTSGRSPTWSEFLTKEPLGRNRVGVVGLVSSWPCDEGALGKSSFWVQGSNRGLFVPHIRREELGPTKCVQKWVRGWLHCADYQLFWKNIRQNVKARICAWYQRRDSEISSGETNRGAIQSRL